jgi:hypothetical protein
MAGDFYHFYEFLVAQGGLEGFYTNPFDSDPEFESKYSKMSFESLYNVVQNISKEDLNKNFKRFARGPIWYIFRSPIIEGLFLKITIPHSEVLVAIAEDINSGKIRLFDKSEMEETWNGISHVNIPIFTSWKQL